MQRVSEKFQTKCKLQLAFIEQFIGLTQDARTHLPPPQAITDEEDQGFYHFILGSILWREGDLEAAMNHYRQAHSILLHHSNTKLLAHILNNMGIIYNSKGKWIQALQSLKVAEKGFRSIGYWRGVGMSLVNISLIHLRKGDLAKVRKLAHDIIDLNNRTKLLKSVEAFAYRNIGLCDQFEGKMEQAEKCFMKALNLMKESGYGTGIVTVYYYLLKLLVEQNRIDETNRLLDEMLALPSVQHMQFTEFCAEIIRGMILKQSPRPFLKMMAEEKFKAIAFGRLIHFDLMIVQCMNC